jgi:hypothetical protein
MTNKELYQMWAPDESPWSAWAKPVLFATLTDSEVRPNALPALPELTWIPKEPGAVAIIIDLPGAESVLTGLALAQWKYRPVPLYNGSQTFGAMVVDTEPIVQALGSGAELLQTLALPPNAPPAFLLDANRLSNSSAAQPGRFDNRWAVIPQDLPSADHLAQAGIKGVFVRTTSIQQDLAHILRRYQEKGLALFILKSEAEQIERLDVPRPSGFHGLWYRLGVFAGLRRNAAGGFGAMIPVPSTPSGG